VVARYADRIGTERAERAMTGWEADAAVWGIPQGDSRFWFEGESWLDERPS